MCIDIINWAIILTFTGDFQIPYLIQFHVIMILQSHKPLVEAYSQLSKRRARKTDQFQKIIQPE